MYDKELSVAIETAKLAGKVIMSYFDSEEGDINLKKDRTLVTKADVESNRIILNELRKNFSSDGIISEESQEVEGKRKWYVDPLDGTESFIRKSDEFAVHIGLCEEGIPVLGVVYRVAKKDIYYCVKGGGAFRERNGVKAALKIQPNQLLETCVISYGDKELKRFEAVLELLEIKKLVRAAATGLRILKIADGEVDIHFISSQRVRPWDICAPQAIHQEAGGQVRYLDGSEILYQPDIHSKKTIIFTGTAHQLAQAVQKTKHILSNT